MPRWIEDAIVDEEKTKEMASATACKYRQELAKNESDFVTVVSVGNNHQQGIVDNFVTVLSIGTVDKNDCQMESSKTSSPIITNIDVHPEEEVEVFRLPGEPLGFGLKFEGGAKNAEKVKRLFVQSCAEQSPASRAKCSWGAIGEGDEVLSIDGVPVTHMSRLDCVRRLKESHVVIKLLVRCRGALRPEVVSAELKSPPETVAKCEKKIPPELPATPPPVPPRKLRHARGSGDGEANPIPAKKTWNGSPLSSGTSSQTDSPQSKQHFQIVVVPTNGKATSDELATPKSSHGSPNEPSKKLPNERSPEFVKSKQEPPEAKVYLDARSQDGSSTHGSTSDDTGSSMSTVVDRFSLSDRFSTVSTNSTTSGGTAEQNGCNDRGVDENLEDTIDPDRDSSRLPMLKHLDQDFLTNPSEYLLKRLANSEAVTHVESRGEAGAVVEKITAVVAPNTVLIEETLTLQPPLSFQDAPLSYGHETRPGLGYTADLAADSTTHFRPIRDEASIVECVNGAITSTYKTYESAVPPLAPTLPARNHVNRISINQTKNSCADSDEADGEIHRSREVPLPREATDRVAPILPPKPLPRKDVRLKRKRPPPPPPPPRREPPPPIPLRPQSELTDIPVTPSSVRITNGNSDDHETSGSDANDSPLIRNEKEMEFAETGENGDVFTNDSENDDSSSPLDSPTDAHSSKTNKVLEIIEMKKVKAFSDTAERVSTLSGREKDPSNVAASNKILVTPAPREKKKLLEQKRDSTLSIEIGDSEESESSEIWQEAKDHQDSSERSFGTHQTVNGTGALQKGDRIHVTVTNEFAENGDAIDDNEDEDENETYRSLDEIKEDFKGSEANGTLSDSEEDDEENENDVNQTAERDSTSDDSEDNGDDYYWQSNLATIGEEEETSSLEYTNANKDANNTEDKLSCLTVESRIETTRGCNGEINEAMKNGTIGDVTKLDCVRRISKDTAATLEDKLDTQVNDRMENCGGDQRLPPDGDEFPATYQEFSACTSEQYQYVETSTRLTPRSNNNAKPSNEGRGRDEIVEHTPARLTTIASTSSKYAKHFTETTGNETAKTLRIESTTKKNSVHNNNDANASYRDCREKSTSYVQTSNGKTPQVENYYSSQYVTSGHKREIVPKPDVSDRNEFPEEANRTSILYSSSSSLEPKNSEVPVVLTEKCIEISNYCTKDAKPPTFERILNPRDTKIAYESTTRETKHTFEKVECDYPDNPPPPLPLTGPPRIEPSLSSAGKNIEKPIEPIGSRKYSLNSDLRRQDDKSEKSVRDKIAMFSSQSSLESPLFPAQTTILNSALASPTTMMSNARKLAKYKSSDDVFNDEKISDTREYGTIERTQSFVDLTDSTKFSYNNDQTAKNHCQRPPTLPKTLPPDETMLSRVSSVPRSLFNPETYQKSVQKTIGNPSASREFLNSEFKDGYIKTNTGSNLQTGQRNAAINDNYFGSEPKIGYPMETVCKNGRTTQPVLARATSFSGESTYTNDLSQSTNSTVTNNGQISRTNSLASTFRRNSEDMRRQSLNQLIEQRRKGISKLRGLVIPEKTSVAVDKPIIDLPEIKSRDSILLHQLPKASIQDKWGSQNSLASNASTASLPVKATTSFKMPAPQIMSKYSPAFKRKSLAVYGNSANTSLSSTPTSTARTSPTQGYSGTMTDPPKSLESICSPTRSDYSFEFVTSTSVSPETTKNNNRVRPLPRNKIRTDYDDSDNDSAVSSSQSSISRGFSPPTSPVPSERSSLSSERSYHASLIMDLPPRHYPIKEAFIRPERIQHLARPALYSERCYPNTERSSSGSSSCDSPNPRSPLPELNPRNSHIPQRQALKRSSSTETNCSSASSSTLTSGSQASAESLSRRVLKPQSVEAINRKNILASARCRSGRDLNGSPLIQRKFPGDEELPISSLAQENNSSHRNNGVVSPLADTKDVKIAYIEITESFEETEAEQRKSERDMLTETLERSAVDLVDAVTNPEMPEASNGLKMWVRNEAKALMAEAPRVSRLENARKASTSFESSSSSSSSSISSTRTTCSVSRLNSTTGESSVDSPATNTRKKSSDKESTGMNSFESQEDNNKRNKNTTTMMESTADTISEDLLTTLTTRTRSRAPINLEDRSFPRSTRQMSLEDILIGKKTEDKMATSASIQNWTIDATNLIGNNKRSTVTAQSSNKLTPTTLPRSNSGITNPGVSNRTSPDDKAFVSKIPMPEKMNRTIDVLDEEASSRLSNERSRIISKIPTQRPLGRRSVSVNDMKKALERTDSIGGLSVPIGNNTVMHHRFPSLDSSVAEETTKTRSVASNETERFNGEQFGSISSLASSTSLISQQELAQLVEEASGLEDSRGNHEVIVVLLHKENPHGSVGITLAGGADCEAKEITVHRVLGHSIADKDGRVQRGDRILSINGRSTRGLTHRESLAVLKQPRSEIVLVVSRSRLDEGPRLRSRTESVETIVEGSEMCGTFDDTAWGPTTRVTIFKDGAGLGFSLAGGRDSPMGDRPLVIKKIFTGGAAEKTASLTAGDQLIEVNGIDVTRMTRIEAWSLMKKLSDGEANLLVRHPATKSS